MGKATIYYKDSPELNALEKVKYSDYVNSGSQINGSFVPITDPNTGFSTALDSQGYAYMAPGSTLHQGGTAEAKRIASTPPYGYSNTSAGASRETYPTGTGQGSSAGSSYSASPYTSRYQAQIDALTSQLMNRAPFSYNALSDPAYQQYKESYTKGGQRGMQDTLGQVSARTGGMASSWSQNAAQQTYDNYMSALADKIPELRQLAYSMYVDEGNNMRNNLSMLMNLDNTDYNRYADDRSFNYGAYRDSVADSQWLQNFNNANSQWQQSFNYNAMRDMLSDQRYTQQYEDSKNETLGKLLAQLTGDYSAYGGYLGATSDQIAALNSAAAAANAAKYRSGSGSGGSGSSGSAGGTGNAGASSSGSGGGSMSNTEYQYIKDGIQRAAISSAGSSAGMAAVQATVDNVWDRLSASQQNELKSVLGQYFR